MKITATIITFNEEGNIRDACESLSWADEVVVVDSRSTDQTREIAEACGARSKQDWPGFAARSSLHGTTSNEWIFDLDADGRVSGANRSIETK